MAATDQPMPEGTDQIIEGAGTGDVPEETMEDGPKPPSSGEKDTGSSNEASAPDAMPRAFFERIEDMRTQGIDRARDLAVQGKDRTTGALDDVLRMVNDAAEQIDSKVGTQYGDYARRAAESLGGFNDALKGKDVDELFNDARGLVARAPAVAIGTAAALGFVIARLARSGMPDSELVKDAGAGQGKA